MIRIKHFIIKLEKDWKSVKEIASESVINGLTEFYTDSKEIASKGNFVWLAPQSIETVK